MASPRFLRSDQCVDDNFSHLGLLLFDRQAGVDDDQAKLLDHAFVLFDDAALKYAKAFF